MRVFCIFWTLVCAVGAQSLPTPGQSPASGLTPDTVVAKVDGKDVTLGQVRSLLQNESPPVIQRFTEDPSSIIGRLLMVRELVAEGEKEKIAEKSPLKEQLEQMRIQAIATGMINYVSNSFSVSGDDVKAFYERNKARYEQGKIKAILVKFKPAVAVTPGAAAPSTEDLAKLAVEAAHSSVQRSEDDARKRASEVIEKLRAGGDFANLAGEYSDDPVSKAAGGDFGVVTQNGSYPDSVKKAVLLLKPTEISEPIREGSGFYVIQMVEKSQQPMSELVEPITEEIRQNHVNEWFSKLTERFRPTIENQEFFLHPAQAIGLKAGPGGPAGGNAAAPSLQK